MGNKGKKKINATVLKYLLIVGSCLEHTGVSFPGNLLFLQPVRGVGCCMGLGTRRMGGILWSCFMPLASRKVAAADPDLQRRCVTGAPGQQPGLLGGTGFEPYVLSCCFSPVSVGCCSLCPVNFSPEVTIPHMLRGGIPGTHLCLLNPPGTCTRLCSSSKWNTLWFL